MKKRGFTIVELLVVIAILGILMGIISTASIGAIKNGRAKRARAMCAILEQAISTYYAQQGNWPGSIESKARNFSPQNDRSWVLLSGGEADTVFQEIAKKSVGASASMPLVDTSALFVADASRVKNNGEGCYDNHGNQKNSKTYCGNKQCISGVDFSVASQKKGKHRISMNSMAFGFAGKTEGRFRRFWVIYYGGSDSVNVLCRNPEKESSDNL